MFPPLMGNFDFTKVLNTLAGELMSVVIPVCITMILSSILTLSVLVRPGNTVDLSAYYKISSTESSSEVDWKSIVYVVLGFVALILIITKLIVWLYKKGYTKIIYGWLTLSLLSIFGTFSAYVVSLLFSRFDGPAISISWLIIICGICGLPFLFTILYVRDIESKPLLLKIQQVGLVLVSVLAAFGFSFFPNSITYLLLFAMAVYDMYAVLTPKGPLKELVELAEERKEPIPGLIYQSKKMKLGLGDFIFYSILVNKALIISGGVALLVAIAVLFGLFLTLVVLLSVGHALPALPFSIFIGLITLFVGQYIELGWFKSIFTIG
ncbi:hypothetical protein PCE1_002159 [Barthelona sp. PCE]